MDNTINIAEAKEVNDAQIETELKEAQIEVKQEPELLNERVSLEAGDRIETHSEIQKDNIKIETPPLAGSEIKTKSNKKEKVVIFKKRKIDNVQQNLRERVDLNE